MNSCLAVTDGFGLKLPSESVLPIALLAEEIVFAENHGFF